VFVFLCVNTELHQLLKLPFLVHHYMEHKAKNPDCTVLDFLKDHYANNNLQSAQTDKEHKNLPFKTTDCTTSHTVLAFDNLNKYLLRPTNTFSIKVKVVDNETIYTSASLSKIWQPPQIG
jgi:hypothetical protein